MLTKGNRFSTTSPLSREARTFLLQFSDSSEERVLADRAMNEEEIALFRAMSRAMPAAVGDRKKNAARRKLQAQWSEQLGVVRINSARARWWNLVDGRSPRGTYGQQPPHGWPDEPPAWDHAEFWGRDRKPSMAVSQPYPWALNHDIDRLDDFADEYGLRFRISNYPSWYFPGRCWFVEWFRDGDIPHDRA